MTKPVRMQLSRRRGFDLQAASQALNGLPAHSIARPGKWGNPFAIDDVAREIGLGKVAARAEAIDRYRRWLDGEREHNTEAPPTPEVIKAELAGMNLACWCPLGGPCHGEILIEIANG